MRAMSLAADDSEGEQNELRTLHGQLNSTNELVQLLSQQLFELKEQVTGPEVIKLFFSCSAQLRLKFIMLINVKMPSIAGILTFISKINYRL